MTRNIVICGVNYAPEFTGVGRYTGEIGRHMAERGDRVCVVTTPPHYPDWATGEGYSNTRWRREVLDGVEVYRCPVYLDREMRGLKRFLSPLSYAISSAPVAFWQILKRRPEVVIVVEPTLLAAPVAQFAAWLAGAKTVLHVQDLEVDAAFAVGHLKRRGGVAALAGWFERVCMRRFHRVITISNRMAEKIVEKGVSRDRIEILRNWVDLGAFRQTGPSSAYRQELGLKADDFVVLYSGALGAKQGVGLLVETVRRLEHVPDVKFVVAGEGPARRDIEAAAADLPNLQVLGFQPEARYAEFLRMADLHILPQERDAADLLLPSKLGGMLASSRPILVTADLDTELSLFLGDSCRLTPPGDAAAAADMVLAAKREGDSDAAFAERQKLAEVLSRDRAIRRFCDMAVFAAPESAGEPELTPVTN